VVARQFLVKLESGRVLWQRNLLKLAQQSILKRTRKTAPKLYAESKKDNEGNGSAYPEGFTVDVEVVEPISLPLHLRAVLMSDPKGRSKLESSLESVIDEAGELTVTNFRLGHASWHTAY
jgi:hypothetical protein